jgi:2-polyprenyl-3-methyl-5-hydroxy-6-metoxy-1,4-benzoquinol methylase
MNKLLFRLYTKLRFAICPIDEVIKRIPTNAKSLIDIGSGFGIFANYIKVKKPKLLVTASELEQSRVDSAKKYLSSNVSFIAKDASKEDFYDYDVITMVDLLHHMPSLLQRRLFLNLEKQTKKGVRIIIKDIEKRKGFRYTWNYVHDSLMTGFDKLYFLSQDDFKQLVKGFKIIEIKRIWTLAPYPHIIIVLEKC